MRPEQGSHRERKVDLMKSKPATRLLDWGLDTVGIALDKLGEATLDLLPLFTAREIR